LKSNNGSNLSKHINVFGEGAFEGVENGLFIALVLIDSKFSNSKKSIEFEGKVSFHEIFDQINELSLE